LAERSWRLDPGPEWDEHRLRIDPNLKRFEENFLATRFVLERDPFAFSRPLFDSDPNDRIFTTRDFMEGFELTVRFTVFESNRRASSTGRSFGP
jgi:hypothetical protein